MVAQEAMMPSEARFSTISKALSGTIPFNAMPHSAIRLVSRMPP